MTFKEYTIKRKAGCIPFIKRNDQIYMAFMSSSDPSYGGSDFMIAKGGVKPNESIRQAALREAEEELGLKKENISEPVKLGWSGELTGLTGTYTFSVFFFEVKDITNFDKPHYETKEVKWLTAKDFNRIGRKSQQHIIAMIANKIKNL